jgi:hypothetical protein
MTKKPMNAYSWWLEKILSVVADIDDDQQKEKFSHFPKKKKWKYPPLSVGISNATLTFSLL